MSGTSPPAPSRDDPFEEETRSLLQARLALMFAVLCGVSLFYGLSHFALRLLSQAEPQSPTSVAVFTLGLAVVMGLLVAASIAFLLARIHQAMRRV